MNLFRLTLFGPPQLTIADQAVAPSRRKGLALLTYLAVTGREQSRDALANLFWPGYVSSTALSHLRRALYALQQDLAQQRLNVGRFQIGLETTTDFWCDVVEFRRLLGSQSADCQHGPAATCQNCRSRLQRAIDLYTNDFLVGFALKDCPDFELWQTVEAEILRQELTAGLEKVAPAEEGQGRVTAAIGVWERLLQIAPLNENAQGNLMRLYSQTGQRDLALHRYHAYCHQLRHELHVEPSPALRRLSEQIRSGQNLVASPMSTSPVFTPPIPNADSITLVQPATLPTPPTGGTSGQIDPVTALGVLQRQKQSHFFAMIDQDGDGQIGWHDFERPVTQAVAYLGLTLESRYSQQVLTDLRIWWEGLYIVYALMRKAMGSGEPRAVRQVNLEAWLRYWGLVQMMVVEESMMGGRETLARMEESIHTHCRLFDTDQDQRLSLQEYTIWMKAWGVTIDAEHNFRQLDRNGDGYLQQSEIVEYLRHFHFSNDPEAPGNLFYGMAHLESLA